jgi:hypothetical protein
VADILIFATSSALIFEKEKKQVPHNQRDLLATNLVGLLGNGLTTTTVFLEPTRPEFDIERTQ